MIGAVEATIAAVGVIVGAVITGLVSLFGSRPDALTSTTNTLTEAWVRLNMLSAKVESLERQVDQLRSDLADATDFSGRLRRALRDLWWQMQTHFPHDHLIDLADYGIDLEDLTD